MNLLDQIIHATQIRVARKKQRVPVDELEVARDGVAASRSFAEAIRTPGVSLIAEFKRRSPSAGEITSRSPDEVAKAYASSGAAAMSVLCEPDFFSGSFADFASARGACDLPLLVKDFVIDPYQVVEARVQGASAVLLIAEALEGSRLGDLVDFTLHQGLDPLVEVHSVAELKRAIQTRAEMIGINQRDLTTFEVDVNLAIDLRPSVPRDRLVIAESGIRTPNQVVALSDAGVDGILVGESLLRHEDPAVAIRELMGA